MNRIIDMNTDRVVVRNLDRNSAFAEHARCNSLALILCLQGEYELEINYSRYHVSSGGMLFVCPLDIVALVNCSDNVDCKLMMLPSGTLTPVMQEINITQFEYMRRKPVMYVGDEHMFFIKQTFLLLEKAQELLDYECFERVAEKQAASLFFIHRSYCSKCDDYTKGVSGDYVSRKRELFRKFINKLLGSHSVSREVLFYANELGMSSGYLNEICNEVSGHSAKYIIDSAVVARLKYELSYTSKSIQELSDEYNFPSQSYFSRYYRRLTGVTPSEFRKKR